MPTFLADEIKCNIARVIWCWSASDRHAISSVIVWLFVSPEWIRHIIWRTCLYKRRSRHLHQYIQLSYQRGVNRSHTVGGKINDEGEAWPPVLIGWSWGKTWLVALNTRCLWLPLRSAQGAAFPPPTSSPLPPLRRIPPPSLPRIFHLLLDLLFIVLFLFFFLLLLLFSFFFLSFLFLFVFFFYSTSSILLVLLLLSSKVQHECFDTLQY